MHPRTTIGFRLARAVDLVIDRLWPAQALGTADDHPWWQRPARWLFVLLLLVTFPIAMNRNLSEGTGTDFPEFYASAKYVLLHGQRQAESEFQRYLPSADVPWIALAILPLPVAAVVYYVVGCWSWMGLLDTTGRYLLAGCSEAQRRQTMLLVGLLVMPIALDGLAIGSFHIFMVWLMVAGLGRVSQGQTWRGGALLGMAVWLKLLPGLGVAYLMLKRKWLPAAVAVGTVVVADIVLSLAAYGPRHAWEEHVLWWQEEGSGALSRQLDDSGIVNEDRLTNQSVAVLLRRTLTRFGLQPRFGMEPVKARNLVTIADCSAAQLRAVYFSAMASLGLAGAYYCRKSWRDTSHDQWASEIALIALGTLWFSPVVWSYHPTSVVPAMAIILSKGDAHPRLTWAIVAAWALALFSFAVPVLRALGHVTLASLLLGAALVWIVVEEGRGRRIEGTGEKRADA